MGKYQTYPEYKDSRIGWMGHIPKDWLTVPVGRLFSRTKRTGHSEKELLSVYRDYGVIPKSSRDDNNNKESDDLTPYQLVQPNDLVMNKMKAWQGSIAISEFEGIVSPAYFVYEPRNILFDLAHPRYIHYLLRNPIYITQYMSRSKGIRVNQWDLDPDEFKTIELLLPSKNEQSKIFNFLDHETAKIDVLIEKQQQLISLLQEKRQAVISHAVTKGLNPEAPMKDSGVEWLGQVPEHWEVIPLKYLVKNESGIQMGPFGGMLKNLEHEETGYKLYGQENTISGDFTKGSRWLTEKCYQDLKTYELLDDDLVLTRKGSLGKARRVENLESLGIIDSDTIRVRVNPAHFNCELLALLMHEAHYIAEQINRTKRGSVLPGLNTETIANLKIVVPKTLLEQNQITNEIKKIIIFYDQALSKCSQKCELLQERRTALISAAVTGKIDVRNWQASSQSSTTSTEEQAL